MSGNLNGERNGERSRQPTRWFGPWPRLVSHLLRNDARLIARDKMLLSVASLVLVLGVVVRLALPPIDAALASAGVMPSKHTPLRLSDTYPAFAAFVTLWQGANLPGVVFGFLMLGEKEDDTLRALQVTPLSLERYAGYRVTVAAVAAFVIMLYLNLAIGHATLPPGQLLPLAAAASLTAPACALAYLRFAENKIQGLAFSKFFGLAGLLVLSGYFVPLPWQWLLGVFPPFLIAQSYWMALEGESGYLWPALGAAGMQLAIIAALLRRLARGA